MRYADSHNMTREWSWVWAAVVAAVSGCASPQAQGPTSPADIVVFYRKPDLVQACTQLRDVMVRDGDVKHILTTSPGTCAAALTKLQRSAFRHGGNAVDVINIDTRLHIDPGGSEVVMAGRVLTCPIDVVVQANGYDIPRGLCP